MAISREVLEKRAVKKGVKVSRKIGHVVSEKELRRLKIQVLPTLPRLLMIVGGLSLILFCCVAWPWASTGVRILEGIGGALLTLFGCFGIRRTLGEILDAGAGDVLGSILEVIVDSVDL